MPRFRSLKAWRPNNRLTPLVNGATSTVTTLSARAKPLLITTTTLL